MGSAKRAGYTYDYPRPALTADVVLLTREAEPRILLIQRQSEPFAGCWALPGGYVDEDETAEQAAIRELHEETGVIITHVEQVYTATTPGRDPRGWTVSVCFLAEVAPEQTQAVAGDDAAAVAWFPLSGLPSLAFDHAELVAKAVAQWQARRGLVAAVTPV